MRELCYCDKEGFWIDDSLDRLGHQYYVNFSHSPNVHYNHLNNSLYSIVDIRKYTELLDYYFRSKEIGILKSYLPTFTCYIRNEFLFNHTKRSWRGYFMRRT